MSTSYFVITSKTKLLIMSSLLGMTSFTGVQSIQPPTDGSDRVDFAVIQLPDTDEMSRYCRSRDSFNQMMQWIADTKRQYNTKIVMSPGDVHGELSGGVCNNDLSDGQFPYISAGYDILDANGIPYLISPANHDMESDDCHPRTTTLWDSTYPVSRFSSQTGFSANYNSKSHTMTNVQTINGNTFMFVTIEHIPSNAVVDWVDTQVSTINPDFVIVGMQEVIKPDSTLATDASTTGDQNYSGQTGVNDIDDVMATLHDVYPEKFILTFGQSYLNSNNSPGFEWAGKLTQVNQTYTQNFTASNFGRIDAGQSTQTACDNRSYLVKYQINTANRTIDVTTYNPNTDTYLTANSAEEYYQHQLTY